MNNPIVHFEIVGPEGPALVAFYRALFDWGLVAADMDGYRHYAFLPSPDVGIGGGVGQLNGTPTSFVTVYVEVADPQSVLDRAVGAGADVVLPVTEIAGVGAIARFRDPQGNIVGLVRSASDDTQVRSATL